MDDTCAPCLDECPDGQYLNGRCSAFMNTYCSDCTNKVADSTYTGSGAYRVDECDFMCNELHTLDPVTGRWRAVPRD